CLIKKGAKRRIFRWICQVFLAKKWGILIKKESESLIFTGLKIPRDYYSKKEVFIMEYKSALSSAVGYAANGRLEEWVHTYLRSDGHNQEFSDGLKRFDRYFLGPVNMPPLIVHYVDSGFELNDGNHRLEAYKRLGIKEYYVIVWITQKEEYAEFMERYSEYLQ
ncbi:MAG: ParB N-terminal domain-containing protein, partial [Lachnospiraceae bacterium]|nr:ParB N-terminal domain-containing protein [Lachnospiraceae bacterium]